MVYSWKDGLPDALAIVENSDGPFTTLTAVDGQAEAFSYSLSGSHRGLFEIDEHGALSLKNNPDYESGDLSRYGPDRIFTVLVRAHTDNGANVLERSFILTIQDEDEFDTGWRRGGNPAGKALNENNNEDTRLADFRATDGDGTASIDYSLSGADANYFSIEDRSGGVGRLYLVSSLDYENTAHDPRYSVVVTADSGDGSTAVSQLYILTVNNRNEANLDDSAATWSTTSGGGNYNENTEGRVQGFEARDSDGGAISYWLTPGSGGDDTAFFSLDSSNRLYVTQSFDYEDQAVANHNHRYTVVVNAQGLDGGTQVGDGANTLTQLYVLTIVNRGEGIGWETGSPTTGNLSENNAIDAQVADFGATDLDGDANVTITYGLRGNYRDDDYFAIDKDTGVLTVTSIFDYEDKNQYTVVVRARSTDGGNTLQETFVLAVGDTDREVYWDNSNLANGYRPDGATLAENTAPTGNSLGREVGDFSARYRDSGGNLQSVNYFLSGDDAKYFDIAYINGKLYVKSSFDYEEQKYYSVLVNARPGGDSGDSHLSSLFILTITNLDSVVSWTANPTGNAISENNAIGAQVADFNATNSDPKDGATITYGIRTGSDYSDAKYFAIDKDSGVLTLTSHLDYETPATEHDNTYTAVVRARSTDGGSTLQETFVLTVGDTEQNDGHEPYLEGMDSAGGASIAENNSIGVQVGTYYIRDKDIYGVDAIVTYSLSGEDAEYFAITQQPATTRTAASLTLKSVLDYEEQKYYSVVINAHDTDSLPADFGPHLSKLFILSITNLDEAVSWAKTTGGNTISENNAASLSVADFAATHADAGDPSNITYGLREKYRDSKYFDINTATGELTVASVLNFEKKERYTVVVRARAGEDDRAEQTFILTVGNVNEFETEWRNGSGYNSSGRNLNENNDAGYLAQFRATDGDGVDITYSLSGTDETYFSIEDRGGGVGRLYLKNSLDFEDSHAALYSVIINAQENGADASTAISQLYVLTLRDRAEKTEWANNTGIGHTSGGAAIVEGDGTAMGATVTDYNAVDLDGATVTYSLRANYRDDEYFSINEETGALMLVSSLDFENPYNTSNYYTVQVRARATDGSASINQTYILQVTDDNDNDITLLDDDYRGGGGFYNPTGISLLENNATDYKIAEFLATDPDFNIPITYSVTGTDSAYFNIENGDSNGHARLYLKSSLDYEDSNHTETTYSVVVTADIANQFAAARNPFSQLFVLTLIDDTNSTEGPIRANINNPNGNSLAENNTAGTLVTVADFGEIDSHLTSTITYGLAGKDNKYFEIDSTTGILTTDSVFDFERKERYTVAIRSQSTDGDDSRIEQIFILTITNLDDNDTAWRDGGSYNRSGRALNENNSEGTRIAQFRAIDGDKDVDITYSLTGDAAYFSIDSRDGSGQGRLYAASSLDFEDKAFYSVVITATSTDSGTDDAVSQTYILSLRDRDDKTEWDTNGNPSGATVSENTSVNVALETFKAIDDDLTASGSSITYGLRSYRDHSYFNIDKDSGVLSVKREFNFESKERYTVVVRAGETGESGSYSVAQTFVLTVTNLDDNATTWVKNPSTYRNDTIAENNNPRTALDTFQADDDDSGATVTYSFDTAATDYKYFSIDANNGKLYAISVFDFEDASHDNSYHIRVVATPTDGGASINQDYRISVSDRDDKTEWQTNPTGASELETIAVGANVGTAFVAIDEDITSGSTATITYGIRGGHRDHSYFNIDKDSGQLTVRKQFDFEKKEQYTVQVRAGETGEGSGFSVAQTFVLTAVNVVDEFDAVWTNLPTGGRVNENDAVAGRRIGEYLATEGDAGTTIIYSLDSANDENYFSIETRSNGRVRLYLKSNLDYEDTNKPDGLYSVLLRADPDDDSGRTNQLFVLTLTDRDEGAQWDMNGNPTGNRISEGNATGVSVADFGATDPEVAGTAAVTYSLRGNHRDDKYFDINSATGVLSVKSEFDFEKKEHYTVVVRARAINGENDHAEQTFVLTITDIDNTAAFSAGGENGGLTISENNTVGFTAGDRIDDFGNDDAGATITYGVSGRDAAYFSIRDEAGWLFVKSTFDYEKPRNATNRYSVIITANAKEEGNPVTQLFVLTIGDVDDATTWRDGRGFNSSGRNINENNNEGSEIARFRATDGDKNVDIDYSLSGGDAAYFSIDSRGGGGEGRLYAVSSFDFEESSGGRIGSRYSVIINAQENGADASAAISRLYVLTLNNQNDADINDTTATWGRRSTGTRRNENEDPRELTRFEAQDADGPGIDYWHSAAEGGDDTAFFSISSDGRLYTTQAFDYESEAGIGKENKYSVVVNALGTAGDNVERVGDGIIAISQLYILTIRNRDEKTEWDTNGNPTGATVSESHALNANVGVAFSAIDDDLAASGGSITYGIRNNYRDHKYFDINETSGQLTLKEAFDNENKDRYTVQVRAGETGEGKEFSVAQTFILTVTEVSDHLTAWRDGGNYNQASKTQNENNNEGSEVARFRATDADLVDINYSLDADDKKYFTIDSRGGGGEGRLYAVSSLDFEDKAVYSVVIIATATDGGAAISQTYMLSLNDQDDKTEWYTNGNPTGATVAESIAVGANVGVAFSAIDQDAGATITYGLTGKDKKYFDIDASGQLTLKTAFTDTNKEHYTVQVRAGETGEGNGFSVAQTFILTVIDSNDSPGWLRQRQPLNRRDETPDGEQTATIKEAIDGSTSDATAGSQVAKYKAIAPNANNGNAEINYSTTGTDAAYFTIDSNGRLFLTSSLDFEDAARTSGDTTNNLYSVVITATSTESGISATSNLFVLSLTDREESARWTAEPMGGATFNEGNTANDPVFTFNATDGDGDKVTYGLTGRDAKYFAINADTGILTATSILDFEDKQHYTITLRARSEEGSNARAEQTFVLTITNVDESPTAWADNGNPSGISLAENNAEKTSIADFSATDGDGAVTYSLSGDDTAYFNINTETGVLSTNNIFDFENPASTNTTNIYTVIVNANATDGSAALSQTFTLSITNADDPTAWQTDAALNPSGTTNAENDIPTTALATFGAVDGDGTGVTIDYGLAGNDAVYFSIDATSGELYLISELDFENPNRQPFYSVMITANSSDGSASINRTFALSITDVDNTRGWADGTPDGITLSENLAIGVEVYNINALNAAPGGGSITFGISGGDHADYFNIGQSDGIITFASVIDFENPANDDNRYSVIINSSATIDGNAITRLFVLTIADVNNTTAFSAGGDGLTISENNTVGFAAANRIDDFGNDGAGATITYGVSGDDADYFSVASTTGWLFLKSTFDYDNPGNDTNTYSVIITANANVEGDAVTQLFVLTITDVDDVNWAKNPATYGNDGMIEENNNPNTVLATFSASDDDDSATIDYSLDSATTDSNYFSINAATGQLYALSSFDFEHPDRIDTDGNRDNSYHIRIIANSSDDSLSATQDFRISVTNRNDPTEWANNGNPDGLTLSENNAVDVVLTTFIATDDDVAVTYSLRGGYRDDEYFAIDSATGILTATSIFNFENPDRTDGLYTVRVYANSTDASPQIQQNFVLTIADVAEPVVWEQTTPGLIISENHFTRDNNRLGFFRAVDGDGADISYSISGNSSDHFSINLESDGRLSLHAKSEFDYETFTTYSVVITASSSDSSPAISHLYALEVNGQNDELTTWTDGGAPSGAELAENNAVNVVVAAFLTADADNPGNRNSHSYWLTGADADSFLLTENGPVRNLRASEAFDFEEKTHHTVIVNGRDTAGGADVGDGLLHVSQTFVLTITNAVGNEPLVWVNNQDGGYPFPIGEQAFTSGRNVFAFSAKDGDGSPVTYSLGGPDASYFVIDANTGQLSVGANDLDYEDPNHGIGYSIFITAHSTDGSTALINPFVITLQNVNDEAATWVSGGNPNGNTIAENNTVGNPLGIFNIVDADNANNTSSFKSFWLTGDDSDAFSIDNGTLRSGISFDFETRAFYTVVVNAYDSGGGVVVVGDGLLSISQLFVLTITDVDGAGLAPDPTTPDQPVGLNGKILFDGTTETIGGISDGIGNDGLVIIGNDLSVTQYDSVSATNTDLILNNIENFADSFVGYTDADGNEQNHWFFVRDDATDNTGHIVFDADGLDVNLDSLNNGGATTTPDQINLLAGLNFNNDGDFNKPDDLDLNLNGNQAASLTHDQFLALIGGSNNIDFI